MLIKELSKEIHENAVAHGWWDGKRDPDEIVALIHSEWSEALEEARAGRPNAYKVYMDGGIYGEAVLVERGSPEYEMLHKKPEGTAVEIIDGCIRILDYFGSVNCEFTGKDDAPSTFESLYIRNADNLVDYTLPKIITNLHLQTSLSIEYGDALTGPNVWYMMMALNLGLSWVKHQGIDPIMLLLEKHEYNKGRPYKHGKLF